VDGIRAEIIPELLFKDRLSKCVPPRIPVLFRAGTHLEKTRTARAEIIGPVAENDTRNDFFDHADRLHGPERFVVDGNRPRFLNGRLVPLNQQNVHTVTAQ